MTRRTVALGVSMVFAASGLAAAIGGPSAIEAVDAFRTALKESAARGDVRASSDFDSLFVLNAARNPAVGAIADSATGNGLLGVGNASGVANATGIKAVMTVSAGNAGLIRVFNGANSTGFQIDGNTGLSSGFADLAEAFSATTPGVEPGTVMVIDPESAGRLAVSGRAYDHRVAGVVAGANEYPSAITLAGLSEKPNKVSVTLSGTVYCRVSAENGRVRAGDLLTTATKPGHAMRVTDFAAARGAILGKAMQDLEGDSGLVLVLASLQ